jgi:hypothetical protein
MEHPQFEHPQTDNPQIGTGETGPTDFILGTEQNGTGQHDALATGRNRYDN